MEKEKPSYYAILPASVRYDPKLTPLQKLLYAEITSLSNKEGYCWATNEYFADLYKVSNMWISQSIGKLKRFGYVDVLVEDNYKRKITPIKLELYGDITRVIGGDITRVIDNNTSINNKNNNISIAEETSAKINPLIQLFESINPSYKTLFGNKTQRKALERLIKEHSYEKVEEMIKSLPEIVKRPYAPRITTPLQFEQKLGELVVFSSQEKNKGGSVYDARTR